MQSHHHQLEDLLQRSLVEQGGRCESIDLPLWVGQNVQQPQSLVLMTLGSYRFHGHFCLLANPAETRQAQLYELANTLCGSFKRQLGRLLNGLGMSTPNPLPADCLPYLLEQYMSAVAARLTTHDGLELQVCLLLPADLSLTLPPCTATPTEQDEPLCGEIELF